MSRSDCNFKAVPFPITVSHADAGAVRQAIATLGLRGPSEFFQRLLHEGKAAGLPIFRDVVKQVGKP